MTEGQSNYEMFLNTCFDEEAEDLNDEIRDASMTRENTVALTNPISGSGIFVTEDGNIQLSAGKELGIILDRNKKSLMVVAPNIHIFSHNITKHEIIDRTVELPKELQKILERAEERYEEL